MLILIAYFFLYVDIYMSSVDMIADFIGFLLLFVAFLIAARHKQCSPLWALLSLVAAVAAFLPWLFLDSYIPDILAWIIPALAGFFLVRHIFDLVCIKAQNAYRHPPEPALIEYEKHLMHWILLFILLTELSSPILGQITIFSYLLWILRMGAGVFVILHTYKMLYWNAYC